MYLVFFNLASDFNANIKSYSVLKDMEMGALEICRHIQLVLVLIQQFVNVGNFNNNNQLDIIVTDEISTNVGVLFGRDDETFASISTVPMASGSSVYSLAIADFNNDTRLNFVVPDYALNNVGAFLANSSKPFGGENDIRYWYQFWSFVSGFWSFQ